MSLTSSAASAPAGYRAVIYLCGTEPRQLDDAEQRCRDYAARFGWQVVTAIYDRRASASPRQLAAKIGSLDAQIILTGTLDMIAPDQDTRDEFMTTLERSQFIVHPVTTPARP